MHWAKADEFDVNSWRFAENLASWSGDVGVVEALAEGALAADEAQFPSYVRVLAWASVWCPALSMIAQRGAADLDCLVEHGLAEFATVVRRSDAMLDPVVARLVWGYSQACFEKGRTRSGLSVFDLFGTFEESLAGNEKRLEMRAASPALRSVAGLTTQGAR